MAIAYAFLIGFLTGLRSLTPVAALAVATSKGRLKPEAPFTRFGTSRAAGIMSTLAGSELVGDKLPVTPARTHPAGLLVRMLAAGFTGAWLASSMRLDMRIGGAAGALGGLVGSFAGYAFRKQVAERLGARDLYLAFIEDAVATSGTAALISSVSSEQDGRELVAH